MEYEHDSFTKEVMKDNVLDIKQWWIETAADAHDRRIAELNAKLKEKR